MWWHDVRHTGTWNVNMTTWFRKDDTDVVFDNPWTWSCTCETVADTIQGWWYALKFGLAVLLAVGMTVAVKLEETLRYYLWVS